MCTTNKQTNSSAKQRTVISSLNPFSPSVLFCLGHVVQAKVNKDRCILSTYEVISYHIISYHILTPHLLPHSSLLTRCKHTPILSHHTTPHHTSKRKATNNIVLNDMI